MADSQKMVDKLKKFWKRAIYLTKRIESWFLGGGQRGARAYETKDGGQFMAIFYRTADYFEDSNFSLLVQ